MSVLPIRELGDPVLREEAREVSREELASAETQALIDSMIGTMRDANGAGLAAPQVGVSKRIAVAEVRPGNPRYPYKPPIPLTVIVNPVLELVDDETFATRRGAGDVGERQRRLGRRALQRGVRSRALPGSSTSWCGKSRKRSGRAAIHSVRAVDREAAAIVAEWAAGRGARCTPTSPSSRARTRSAWPSTG